MDRLLFSIILCSFLYTASASSSEKCADEKKRVDYWNDLMRERVTEARRTYHREAKAEFLDCLGKEDSVTSHQLPTRGHQSKQSSTRSVARRYINTPIPKKGYTQNVYISGYHNFKGAKRAAWLQYFQESPECIKNNGDMNIFVKCANERKHFLKQFNQNWNEKTQSLDSPISTN